VSAINIVGESVYSETFEIVAAEVPDPPTNLELVFQDPTQIRIRWQPAHDGGTPIRDFHVYWDQSFGSYIKLEPSTGSPYIYEYLVTQVGHGLQTGSINAFKVAAVNDVGESLLSERLDSVMAAELPTAPLDLRLVHSTQSTLTFEWSEPSENGGTPITDYMIYWDAGDST
jgi:hypothetical protein